MRQVTEFVGDAVGDIVTHRPGDLRRAPNQHERRPRRRSRLAGGKDAATIAEYEQGLELELWRG